ncbi:MAG: 2-oxoglutarate oxidoreductase [Deltaproteobacteria bacterium RIFOXYA12_FULL_61_11]|nr:MAG: 2-oxoglutarate oxidoreductase [Deltaproteobacteria bacterium RIFOXYA12_FULL_61_11]
MTQKETKIVREHIIEIVCDSGEGAQKAGVSLARLFALNGNGLWTVEIIPAEIQPPPHTTGSTSGIRLRVSENPIVTNVGDYANLVFAFNEMSLLSRIEVNVVAKDATVIIDNMWKNHENPEYRASYARITEDFKKNGGTLIEVPVEELALQILDDPRRGKNMLELGYLTYLYSLDYEEARKTIMATFAKKAQKVIDANLALLELGYKYADEHLDFRFQIPAKKHDKPMISMNGNQAVAFGSIAAGFELCSMYPITPATSASFTLADHFEDFGGFIHQAEDEIAAIGVAVGASYAGRRALTITSGPGMALKTEFQGLAVMTEIPLVIVDVQRGGPSTGLPTKIEQSDLLHCLFGAPGDAPKIILAASSIEECYYIMATARQIAEEFRMVVIVLTDANLATGVQLFPRPTVTPDTLPPPLDLSPVPPGTKPFDWDEQTGLSRRIIPGQPGGMSVTTTLNHTDAGKVGYDAPSNQRGHRMRSRKLAAFQKTLKVPTVYGDQSGDLLIVGWGSTKGSIVEAIDRVRAEGHSVSYLHLTFLNPLPPGLKGIFSRFKKVMTIELNYSDDWGDPLVDETTRRYAQLAYVLRAHTLMDIDCWSRVLGRPFMPRELHEVISLEVGKLSRG